MSSLELMNGLEFVKNLLIKPYFNENNEGKKIQYVIELKDSFLSQSTLVKSAEEINLLKEWMGTSYIITEPMYRASKDGFTASSFHAKCDGKGANIVLIKSKTG